MTLHTVKATDHTLDVIEKALVNTRAAAWGDTEDLDAVLGIVRGWRARRQHPRTTTAKGASMKDTARFWAISGIGYGKGFTPQEALDNYVKTQLRSVRGQDTVFGTKVAWAKALRAGEARPSIWQAPEGTTGFLLDSRVRWTDDEGKRTTADVQDQRYITLGLAIDNHYDDGVVKTTATVIVPVPPGEDDEDARSDWENDYIMEATGTDRPEGNAAYFVTVTDSDIPEMIAVGTKFEFGL